MENARSAQRARMSRLSAEPHTEVLEYAYEVPERDADAVTCVKMATLAVEIRRSIPSDVSLRKATRLVCAQNAALKQFSRTHPQIFLAMMDIEKCGPALEMLHRLARLRQSVEEGMSEAEANVHANRLIMEKTMREPTSDEQNSLSFPENKTTTPEPTSDERNSPCSLEDTQHPCA